MFSGGGCVDAVREAGDCEFVESPEALAIVTLLLHWFDTRVELQMLSASYSHPTHLKEWDPSHEVDVFFNVTSHLTQLPIFLTPMCEGLYSLQWAVVIALLGSVILLVALLTLASRREKYNHMVVLAYLKRDLANELDKNNDGKIDSLLRTSLRTTSYRPAADDTVDSRGRQAAAEVGLSTRSPRHNLLDLSE